MPESDKDPISKKLGLTEITTYMGEAKTALRTINRSEDHNIARDNLLDLIDKGTQILGEFSQIAASTQEARFYEVLANLLTTLIDANERLIILKKHEVDIAEKEKRLAEDSSDKIVNNNLFVGSTADLKKMIDGMKNAG